MAQAARLFTPLLLALLAGASAPASAIAQPVEGQDADFESFQLRTEENPALNLEDGLGDPFDPALLDQLDLDAGPATEPTPPFEDEPADDPAPAAPVAIDLFAGPSGRSERGNLPLIRRAEPAAAAEAVGPDGTPVDDGSATTPGTADPFRASGPVRSPTFSPAATGRLNRSVSDLRASFPGFEEDPYAPQGIRVGRFILFPELEQEIGATDNLDEDATEEGGVFSRTAVSARFVSDWARHEAEVTGTAAYRRNGGGEIEEDPTFGLDALLRLDISEDTAATLRGAFSFAREDPILADPLLPPSDRPDVLAYSVGVEVERAVGVLDLTVGADIVREERRLGGEFTELSGADDFTTASLSLRTGYGTTAAVQPFVGGSIGRRIFDRDSVGGESRDSLIPALRAGLAIDFGEKISGEAAIGYAWNVPDGGGGETLGAPTVDATVNWSPRRGTDVILTGLTFFDPDDFNLSTSTVYEAALALRHRATARLDLTSRLSLAHRDREGAGTIDDTTYAGETGLTYWLNRALALTALARHERLVSEIEAAEYSANTALVGIRLQR